MNVRFSPSSEFPATGSHPAAASSPAASQRDAVAGTYSSIRDGQFRPRSQAVAGSAHRANSACGGRANSTSAPHYIAEQSFERGEVAQAPLDVLLVTGTALFVASVGIAIVGAAFICFFVET